jgi:DNA-binding response OmpR family regulator
LSNASEGGSGWNQVSAEVQRFSLRSRAKTANEKDPELEPYSILLIEDNIADVGLVREALEEHNVQGELLVISDGASAIRFIDDLAAQTMDCPDLVILDLNLPKRSGREVLESMRKNSKCQDTTIVVLSSSDAPEDKADASNLGAHHYLRKPSRLTEFMDLGAKFKQLLAAARNKSA